jgi:hypothetical protein
MAVFSRRFTRRFDMVCQACGAPVTPDVHFCPRCGAQVVPQAPPQGYAPPSPAYAPYMAPLPMIPRVRRHIQTLGILWCAYAGLKLIGIAFGAAIFRVMAYHQWDRGYPFHRWDMPWVGAPWIHFMPLFIGIAIVMSLFGMVVGYGLLSRQTWGRVLAIVAAILVLFKPLLGTALGIYTLWVLAPAASGLEYETIVQRG